MSQQTPLDSPESEIRTLIEEAAKELQTDQIKKELTAKIQGDKSRISLGSIASHPAFLVIVGFIFTGIFGTIITARWQSNEWDRQQTRLLQLRRIEQKEKITEDLTRKVAESDATEQDVLIAFRPWWRSGDRGRDQIARERLEAWRKQGGREWRIETRMLGNKLDFLFTDSTRHQKIQKAFEEILDRRERVAVRIAAIVDEYSKGKDVRANQAMQDEIDAIEEVIDQNKKSLGTLDLLILEDIDNAATVRHTIWQTLADFF